VHEMIGGARGRGPQRRRSLAATVQSGAQPVWRWSVLAIRRVARWAWAGFTQWWAGMAVWPRAQIGTGLHCAVGEAW
jgi:hypothetical protein